MDRGSGERDGLDDTIPASEPPTDIDGNPMRSSGGSIPPFQRYRLGAELGRGGMGRVVEAFDTQLGRTVALKEVLPKGPGVAKRFAREVQITARLEHPAIVPLYDSGTTADGRPFYVMRRVTGKPLDEIIKRAANLAERLVLLPNVLAAIDAVAHAHRRGVIHRDLKPANILVGELGETVVIDWGLAKVVGEDETDAGAALQILNAADSLQTQVGSVFGTPGFMAPEQVRGDELGARSDVYALGATLYQLLAGGPPHAGTSATEVLEGTLKHEVLPLAEAAPGAPVELIAIVDKALSFEPETRYADAGALGEDVRRFLGGQLVAAHRYTPRQKLGRFAKRHRAALTIAAAAMVVLAVLAWISVSRVISERDEASAARQAAELDKRAAEAARDRLAERNDTLIVTQARAQVETNPTQALATLKQLDPRSVKLDEAKAVGQAAVMRGAWTAIHSTEQMTFWAELSPDGKLLIQLSRDGDKVGLRLWNLDSRRLVSSRTLGRGTRAIWLTGNTVLVYGEPGPPEILDATTGQVTATLLPPLSYAIADGTGMHAILVDKARHAFLYDAGARTVTPLWPGHDTSEQAIAPDGSWIALADKQGLVVLDAAGKELGSHAGAIQRLAVSDHRRIAVLDGVKLLIATVDAPMQWTEIDATRDKNARVLDLAFRGDELNFYVTSGDVLAYRSFVFTNRTAIRQFTYRLTEAGDHVMIVPSMDGKLYLTGDQLDLAVALPTPVANIRIAARVGQSRFAVVGVGVVLLFDLDAVAPRRIPVDVDTQALFVDDDTLLSWRNVAEDWRWIDLRTGKQTPFNYPIEGIPIPLDVDGGRVLIGEALGPSSRIALLRKGESKRIAIATGGQNAWGRLIEGNAVIFGGGDGRVFGVVGDQPPHEVVKLDGKVVSSVSLGSQSFAALSDKGELVRSNLANGAVERTTIAGGNSTFIAGDLLGHVLIVEDNRMLMWDADRVFLVYTFDRNIQSVTPTEIGIMITLVDGELQLLDLTGAKPPRRLMTASTRAPRVQASGRLVIGTGSAEQLVVLELPSFARWEVPVLFQATNVLGVAPNGRRVMQGSMDHLVVWELPQARSDFAAWLDEQTNAVVSDDLLAWPWQINPPR